MLVVMVSYHGQPPTPAYILNGPPDWIRFKDHMKSELQAAGWKVKLEKSLFLQFERETETATYSLKNVPIF